MPRNDRGYPVPHQYRQVGVHQHENGSRHPAAVRAADDADRRPSPACRRRVRAPLPAVPRRMAPRRSAAYAIPQSRHVHRASPASAVSLHWRARQPARTHARLARGSVARPALPWWCVHHRARRSQHVAQTPWSRSAARQAPVCQWQTARRAGPANWCRNRAAPAVRSPGNPHGRRVPRQPAPRCHRYRSSRHRCRPRPHSAASDRTPCARRPHRLVSTARSAASREAVRISSLCAMPASGGARTSSALIRLAPTSSASRRADASRTPAAAR